ncbi:hypothetical protein [Nonomuraea sp. SYSU D8015]|uniref:hypothetical protein n=1 Tax=Nonomuraea sp. SYSU D8015 TaxID=2593644 RepID=UPI001CB7571D|nr:hypothetical protein [Nonomuraea sp. SYSU D8015]
MITTIRTLSRYGRLRTRLAAQIARYSKMPVLLEHPDDHHPEQEEDDVPVDVGVLGEERRLGAGGVDGQHDGGSAERGGDPVDLLGAISR